MEISTATNATNIAAVASNTKSPDADFETPVRIHSSNTKPLTFTNGVLKRHQPLLHHNHHHHHGGTGTGTTNIPIVVVYKECLKNHAASLGGHALDGCGEFMPSPTATPTDPTSLKCAACGCHRNFHRREPDDPIPLPTTTTTTQVIEYQPHHRHHPPPPPPRGHSPSPPSPPPISSSYYPSSAPHMLLALSAGLQGGPPQPPPDNPHSMGLFGTPTMAANTNSGTATNHNGRKRFRTRFSQGQKEKMYEFAERVGWKMQKKDEETVSEFCNEIGVDRSVLKVWMHNNKNSLGKKSSPQIPSSQADHHHLHQNHHHHHHHHHLNGSSRNGTTFDQNDTTTTTTNNNNNNNNEDEDDDENNIQHHHNGGTNGSSSSS